MSMKGGLALIAALLLLTVPASSAMAGDNPFPLLKGSMPDWFSDGAPLPSGITLGYTRMVDEMVLSNVSFAIGGQALPAGAIAIGNVTHHTNIYTERFDTWVLPFLNVFKKFGEARSPGMLSFPRPGVTLALDFPFRGQKTLALLEELCDLVRNTSLCGLGQGAPTPVITTMQYFRNEYDAHVAGECPAGVCAGPRHGNEEAAQ